MNLLYTLPFPHSMRFTFAVLLQFLMYIHIPLSFIEISRSCARRYIHRIGIDLSHV